MSPDGEAIVTGAGDETLRFWNVFSKTRSTKVRPDMGEAAWGTQAMLTLLYCLLSDPLLQIKGWGSEGFSFAEIYKRAPCVPKAGVTQHPSPG